MICEYCLIEHDGNYGSGRFCSSKCSRGFSTSIKRTEINEKVSKKLYGSGNPNVIKFCKTCNKEFIVRWKYRSQVYCSNECSIKNIEVREKIACAPALNKNKKM